MTRALVPWRVGDTLHALGEAPVWRDRALWYVDLLAPRTLQRLLEVGDQVTGILEPHGET